MHRKLWVWIPILLLILALVVSACVSPPAATSSAPAPADALAPTQAPISLKVCYSSLSGTQSVAPYAYEKGLFQRYGLDVELVYIDSGSKAAIAMVAGEVDFCQIAGSAAINAAIAGAPLRIIAGLFNTYIYSLMVLPEIQQPSDLVGKAVAISRPGSSSDVAMRVALQGLGLKPDDEVTVLAVGGQSERLAAMLSGQAVGTLVSLPETLKAREQGFHSLLDMSDLNAPYQHTAIAAQQRYVEADRAIGLRFLQAISEAAIMMKSDRQGFVEVTAQYMLLDPKQDRPALDETFDGLILPYLQVPPYPSLPGIQSVLNELVAENPQAADAKPESIADSSLVRELEQNSFYAELQKKYGQP